MTGLLTVAACSCAATALALWVLSGLAWTPPDLDFRVEPQDVASDLDAYEAYIDQQWGRFLRDMELAETALAYGDEADHAVRALLLDCDVEVRR